MSSYLNFYLVPKKKKGIEKPEPLLLTSYSRSSDVYQSFYETLNPAFIGSGETPNYTEIDAGDVRRVVDNAKDTLNGVEKRLQDRIEAYKTLSDKVPEDAIQDYVETKEYISELKESLSNLEGIYSWISDIEYSDFEKVLINID